MNCPECGASVSVDDRFCGNCGTPLDQDHPAVDQIADVKAAEDAEASTAPEEQGPVWETDEPTGLPDDETSVPDPSGTPAQSLPPPPPPPTMVKTGGMDRRLVIAIVVVVVLLLCCCVAAIVVGLYMGTEDLASAGVIQRMSEVVSGLLAAT